MHDLPADWGALCAQVFLLGMRHGLDADHLAAIDGLTRVSARRRQGHSRYCGPLFSMGHGFVVLSIALPTTSIGTRMRVFAASNAAPWMRFDTAQGSAWVRLDVSLGPEFSMASDQTVPPSGALPEGDMLLF